VKCSFSLIVKRENDTNDSSWMLKVINSTHIHFFSLIDAYFVLRRLVMTKKIKSDISRQLIIQIALSQMFLTLRIANFIIDIDWKDSKHSRVINFMFKSRDIYNFKAQIRRDVFESLTFIQVLIQQLDRENWTYVMKKNENNQIIHFFFNKESFRSILKKNHEILIMNATYKINRYKMSFLIISEQTTLNITFHVAFCFMTQKTSANYIWILRQLKAIYLKLKLNSSVVIITNMRKNLMRVINLIFSDANHLLCLWHININVVAYCKRDFDDKDAWNVFFSVWKSMMYVHSEKKFWKNWEKFC
jgi:hypothetical protein